MEQDRKKEIIVGVVSILALAMLIFGLTLGENVTLGEKKHLYMMFPSSSTIKPTAPVLINGVERGSVVSIENKKDSVLIKAEFNKIDDIKTDAIARILMLELTGGRKINIKPGKNTQKVSDGDYIKGVTSADLSELVAIVGDVSDDLVGLVRGLDSLIISANSLIGDEKLINDFKSAVAEASELAGSVNSMVKENKDDINLTIRNMKSLTTDLKTAIEEQTPNIEQIISDLKQASDKAVLLLDKADGSFDKIDKLFTDVNNIITDIKSNDSVLNKLLYDKEMAARLDSALTNLGSFIDKIDQHGVNVNVRLGTRP